MGDNEAQQLLKAQQQLGPILRFIANQPVSVPPLAASFSAPPAVVAAASGQQDRAGLAAAREDVKNPNLLHQVPSDSRASAGNHMTAPPMVRPGMPVVEMAEDAGPFAAAEALYRQVQSHPATSTHALTSMGRGTSSGPTMTSSVMSHRTLASGGASSADDAHFRKLSVTSAGAVDNDSADDDEDDSASTMTMATSSAPSHRISDHRRQAHTTAEQKRRDDIKQGYEELAMLIPSCQPTNNNGQKLSKAVILQKSIDYLGYLKKHRQQQEQDLSALRNEVVALRIMKRNYEQIAKAHHTLPPEKMPQVSDAAKFEVFKAVMDTLFQSFDACISVNSFEVLSSSIFQWLEEFCKPQNMRGIVISSLQTLQKQPQPPMYNRT